MSQSEAAKKVKNLTEKSQATFEEMANAIRFLSADAVEKAKSGHPGMPMGMADVGTVLFTEFLKFDPKNPNWPDRDRFVLSAGHGSMFLYSILHLLGYEDMTMDEIKNFRQLHSKTAGHPEFGHAAGIETTTGPLGQGLATSVGMAIAEKILQGKFGKELVNHKTYVITGDGCLMEGISHEAISLAGHLKLNNLIVIWDDNEISIDGPTNLSVSDDQIKRFQASGWKTIKIDGHNAGEIRKALQEAQNSDIPVLIACRTTIGYGAPKKAGTSATHGSPLGDEEIRGARAKLSWAHEAFHVPEHVLNAWRETGRRHSKDFREWQARLDKNANKLEFERVINSELPKDFEAKLAEFKAQLFTKKPKEATRQSSGNALEFLNGILPELVGGSADLTGSNNTKTSIHKPITSKDFSGRYVYYGVREHAMGAAMNGMALHKGIIPYGGSFLVFTDYCRPAIRLAALMQQRSIFVMTHDSIGLGEDGPTHQPVEHLAALRAIPNLYVLRPCDAIETLECWEIAIKAHETPSVLALTRQALPTLRQIDSKENLSSKGGYIISKAEGVAKVSILATGSEVEIAVAAQEMLKEKGITADVVSMPCVELFDAQPENYRKQVLPSNTLKVAVEAAVKYGWERYIGIDGIFVGMPGFGASAPYQELYKHFKITAEEIVSHVARKING